jgi:excisionase family DNA binding protein
MNAVELATKLVLQGYESLDEIEKREFEIGLLTEKDTEHHILLTELEKEILRAAAKKYSKSISELFVQFLLQLGKAESLLTVSDVAAYLKIKESTVRVMINKGEIPAVKIGKAWRIQKEELTNYLRGRSGKV